VARFALFTTLCKIKVDFFAHIGKMRPDSHFLGFPVAKDTKDIVPGDEGVWLKCLNSEILVGFPVPRSLNILANHGRRWPNPPSASYRRLVLLGVVFHGVWYGWNRDLGTGTVYY